MTSLDAPLDVLLVEDNPNDVQLTLRALRKVAPSARVGHLDDGARALDFLLARGEFASRGRGTPPRVVLLDLKLPKIDGLEVLRRLKDDEGSRAIPVAVLTSSREARDVDEAYRAGANSYVVKPVNFDVFTRSLGDVVRYWLEVNRTPWHGGYD